AALLEPVAADRQERARPPGPGAHEARLARAVRAAAVAGDRRMAAVVALLVAAHAAVAAPLEEDAGLPRLEARVQRVHQLAGVAAAVAAHGVAVVADLAGVDHAVAAPDQQL